MLKTIPFVDRQEARHTDFNGLQTFARASFDAVVKDAVTSVAAGYAGFVVTKNGANELVIATGRIYRADGAVFEMGAAATKGVAAILPVATKRVVAVIAYGQEEDSRSEIRDFLVDLESDTTEPRTVVVERRRAAVVDLVPGQESATLPRPAIASGLMVVAWVTLNTTGIETIEMEAANKLPSISSLAARIDSLEKWRKQLGPRLDTFASDITALKRRIGNAAGTGELVNLMKDIARLKERLDIPDTASDWGSDRFLTADESDTENIDFLALIEEGIRFSHAARDESQIQLYNPNDPNAYLAGNGLLLPAVAKKVIRLASSSGALDGKIPISQYGFQTHQMKQRTVARSRMRYGPAYNVSTYSNWWADGKYDSATNTFTRNGETFVVTGSMEFNTALWSWLPTEAHGMVRLQQFWEDSWNESYWVAQLTDRTVSGAQIAQTFLNSQNGWLSGVNLLITDKGPDSDIHVSIAHVSDAGMPDPNNLVSHVTVPYASIKLAPKETYIAIPPCLLEAGERYAIVITTLGSHKVGIVDSNEYAQGTLFYSTDGAYYAGDLERDLWFELEFLQFKASRVELEFTALSLSGGIANMDVLAGSICPKSCKIEHQVQISGAWKPLNKVTPNLLAGLPPLLRHRVVLTGTSAVAPAIEVASSRIRVWRQRTTMKHISTPRTLATTATSVKVDLALCDFDPARHSVNVKLRRTSDNVLISPTGFVDSQVKANRRIRTFAFAPSPAIAAYRIEIEGTTNNALVQFQIEERTDIAL